MAGVAGYVNALLLSSSFHVPVSHMTGAVSLFAIDLVDGQYENLLRIAAIIGGFLGGAVVSGLVVGSASLKSGRRYGVAMMIESAAFAVAATAAQDGRMLGLTCAAFGCGVQNGMASSYLGLILRTTHVTGIVTDLGVLLGERLRGRHIEWWKVGLLVILLGAFASGGILGVATHHWAPQWGLWIVSAGMAIAGISYWIYRRRCALTDH